jgi:hypothetical protein
MPNAAMAAGQAHRGILTSNAAFKDQFLILIS